MQTDRLTLVLVIIIGISATAIGFRNLMEVLQFVQPSPTYRGGFLPPVHPDSGHGCKSWSFSHPCAPTILALCGYRSHLPASALQNCGETYDTLHVY